MNTSKIITAIVSKEMNAKTRPVHSVNVSMHLQMTFIAFIESTFQEVRDLYTGEISIRITRNRG